MLVLNRKVEEQIKVGDDIVVSVLEVDGSSVKLGIEAPREVVILRMEVYERIRNENIDSAAEKELSDITEAADLIKTRFSGSDGK